MKSDKQKLFEAFEKICGIKLLTENFDNDNINYIFYLYPDLNKIGSKLEYKKYLNTIFPNTKIKDIVYHGTMEKLIPKDNFKGYITYFSSSKEYAETFGFPINRKIVLAKINVKNPYYAPSPLADVPKEVHLSDQYTNPRIIKQSTTKYDSVIGIDAGQKEGKTIAIFNPAQIHILGSENDLKQFKLYLK